MGAQPRGDVVAQMLGVPGDAREAARAVVVGATSRVSGGRIAVGCRLDRPALRRCVARLTVRGRTVGTGAVTVGRPGATSAKVRIRLKASTLKNLRRGANGVRAKVVLRALVLGDAAALTASKGTRVVCNRRSSSSRRTC